MKKFNIIDTWYRYEWQGRGSVHCHGVTRGGITRKLRRSRVAFTTYEVFYSIAIVRVMNVPCCSSWL
jgi:hypothetical protein